MEDKPFRLQVPSGRLSGPTLNPVRAFFGGVATGSTSRGRLGAMSAHRKASLLCLPLRCRVSIGFDGQMGFVRLNLDESGLARICFQHFPGIGDNGLSDNGLATESGPWVLHSPGYALILKHVLISFGGFADCSSTRRKGGFPFRLVA